MNKRIELNYGVKIITLLKLINLIIIMEYTEINN